VKTNLEAVIAAAGKSLRMGTPKQLLFFAGMPLAAFAIRRLRAAGVKDITLVVGCYKEKVLKAVEKLDVKIAENHIPNSEMIDSIRAGLENVSGNASGVMIVPVDSCFASAITLEALMALHLEKPERFIRPYWDNRGGHPLIIPAGYIRDIKNKDLQSLRHLVRQKQDIINMHCTDPGAFLDLDTLADYKRALDMETVAENLEQMPFEQGTYKG